MLTPLQGGRSSGRETTAEKNSMIEQSHLDPPYVGRPTARASCVCILGRFNSAVFNSGYPTGGNPRPGTRPRSLADIWLPFAYRDHNASGSLPGYSVRQQDHRDATLHT
ncbi:hypothetical protein BD311DRAFT_648465 [Dichomitus squalens]|uniref:Uncharacterized protein n=1 Tax=Dichomitus squalens TaxID=114155 RepID=A0A4Q9N4X3_9APHY|nr:hypothetical protein BD311DRAFT_648465 [Dichomitus squalens]